MRNSLVNAAQSFRNRPLGTHWRLAVSAGLALSLSACVSLGADIPDRLLTLTANDRAPIGVDALAGSDNRDNTIAVVTPEVPAKLDVLRLPVNVSPTEVAYLADTIWVEKPARLFRNVVGETLRAKGAERAITVLDTDEAPLPAGQYLRGTLEEMSFDAQAGEVVVRYDAIRSDLQGESVTRRFEARASAVAEPGSVGPALNKAVNQVASEVADWVLK